MCHDNQECISRSETASTTVHVQVILFSNNGVLGDGRKSIASQPRCATIVRSNLVCSAYSQACASESTASFFARRCRMPLFVSRRPTRLPAATSRACMMARELAAAVTLPPSMVMLLPPYWNTETIYELAWVNILRAYEFSLTGAHGNINFPTSRLTNRPTCPIPFLIPSPLTLMTKSGTASLFQRA